MKSLLYIFFIVCISCGAPRPTKSHSENQNIRVELTRQTSHFKCRKMGQTSWRPYYMKFEADGSFKDYSQTEKGLLGQNPMRSEEECQRAIDAANLEYGAICSRTGLNGWKPTTYTGTVPGRRDFGYLGGSSIMKFEDCLAVTKNSSRRGVCYWGGTDWYISEIDRATIKGGPFRNLQNCLNETRSQSLEN